MKRFVALIAVAALGVLPVAPSARAQGSFIGGHVETSEIFTAAGGWTTAALTPGVALGAPSAPHLVFSEVAPRGFGVGTGSDSSEYIEIFNPMTHPVSLDNYYISDDIGYYRIVNGVYPVVNATDFALRFPAGLALNPGRVLLLCVTKAGYAGSGGTPGPAQYFLEMKDTNGNPADDMIVMTTVSTFPVTGGNLTNPSTTNGEWLVLYSWNGSSDLVCDVDYASWGANSASNPKMDKTGVLFDGPDADVLPSSYSPDVAAAGQTNLGTALAKPTTFQRVGGEVGEVAVDGNGCRGRITPILVDWVTNVDVVRFHIRWANPDPDNSSDAATATVHAQEFGVFLPDLGLIQEMDIPPVEADSFFDVFFEVPLSALPPSAPTQQPGSLVQPAGGLQPAAPCPPPTNWNGNLDIVWSGPGYTGQVNKHYGELVLCPGAAPSYIHVRSSNCPTGAPWTVAGLCPGFGATLVNEDLTPAPNPVPPGWTGWICVSAGAGVPAGTNCCFTVNFTCAGAPAVIDICATACDCTPPRPSLTVVDWTNLGVDVRFHLRWENPDTVDTSLPVSGDMSSQDFGVFQSHFGPIGHFDVPPIAPSSFFDIFFDVPLAQLPPEPVEDLPGGGPTPGGPQCPPSTQWNGNVDVIWSGQGGAGQINKHYGDLLICPGAPPSYIHVRSTNCTVGALWTINGLCSGFGATLVNEDKTPAPNPVPPGWTGWICVSADATTPVGTNCCFTVDFDCGGLPAVIDLCAITCDWRELHPTLSQVDWTNVGPDVRFHLRWQNDDPTGTSLPVSGDMNSQPFGVFQSNFGPIGHFDVPPIAPSSFFDVFFDVPLGQLPPEPPKELPGGGPPPTGTDCPPSQAWNGNVDLIWTGQGGSGTTQKHQGDLLVNLGSTPAYIHVGFTNCPVGAPWTITGLCPGFSATLVNEDKTPAPNPIPAGWSGWICVSATAATPSGTTCCIKVNFDCAGSPGVIDLCATSCQWDVSGVSPFPVGLDFGIFRAAPNPTSSGLVIDFVIPRDGAVRVDVFDLSGRHVRTLLDGPGRAGVTSVRWDGSGDNGRAVAPGAYFIRLSAAGRSDSRKAVITP